MGSIFEIYIERAKKDQQSFRFTGQRISGLLGSRVIFLNKPDSDDKYVSLSERNALFLSTIFQLCKRDGMGGPWIVW